MAKKKKKKEMPSESERYSRIEKNWEKLTRKQRNRYFNLTKTAEAAKKAKSG
jgi:hypothetical protein